MSGAQGPGRTGIIQENEDLTILYDRLALIQGKKGQRFGIDAVLLAEHVTRNFDVPLLEIGTGCGVSSIILGTVSMRGPIVAVEIQDLLADRARRNVVANNLEDIVEVMNGDIRDPGILPDNSFSRIFSNPPFFPEGSGRLSPDSERAAARHEILMNMKDLMSAIARLLAPGGVASVLYPWERLDEIRSRCANAGLALERITPGIPGPLVPPVLAICDIGFDSRQDTIVCSPVSLDRKDHDWNNLSSSNPQRVKPIDSRRSTA